MSDLPFLVFFFYFMKAIYGYEETELLMLIPSGGRYDPSVLWETDQSLLVGVNDCHADHIEPVEELAVKGTFKSPMIMNLTFYDQVKLDYYIYNDYGEEILHVGPCPLTNETSTCDTVTPSLINGPYVTGNDGWRLYEDGTVNTLIGVFNPRHYLNEEFSGVNIIVGSTGSSATMNTPGYKFCSANTNIVSIGTPISDISIDKCYDHCEASNPTYPDFALDATTCYCIGDPSTMVSAVTESNCDVLCPGNADHLCGGANFVTVFKKAEYANFKAFYNGIKGTASIITTTITEATAGDGDVDLGSLQYISAAKVELEEECQLTNLYFEVPETKFTLSISSDCSGSATATEHATLVGDGTMETFDTVQTQCVYFSAEQNNYTYPRANITLFGPTGDMVSISGIFVITGTWTIEESTSIESSWYEETTSLDMSTNVPDITSTMMEESSALMADYSSFMPSTTMEEATSSIELNAVSSDQAGLDASTDGMAGGPTTATVNIGNSYEPTSVDTGASASAAIDPSASAAIDPSASSGMSSSDAVTTAAPTTGGGTTAVGGSTTTSPAGWLTKDGRLVVEACTCICKQPPLRENQTLLEQAQEKAEELSEELSINTKNLSATVRKKESATDERPSASAGGYAAIILLSLIGVLFIVADAISITAHVEMLKTNLSGLFNK